MRNRLIRNQHRGNMTYTVCIIQSEMSTTEIKLFDTDETLLEHKKEALKAIQHQLDANAGIRFETIHQERLPELELKPYVHPHFQKDITIPRIRGDAKRLNQVRSKIHQEGKKESYQNLPVHFCDIAACELDRKRVRFLTYADFEKLYQAKSHPLNALFSCDADFEMLHIDTHKVEVIDKNSHQVYESVFPEGWIAQDHLNYLWADTNLFFHPGIDIDAKIRNYLASPLIQTLFPETTKGVTL